jgi:hypothetical protein
MDDVMQCRCSQVFWEDGFACCVNDAANILLRDNGIKNNDSNL